MSSFTRVSSVCSLIPSLPYLSVGFLEPGQKAALALAAWDLQSLMAPGHDITVFMYLYL